MEMMNAISRVATIKWQKWIPFPHEYLTRKIRA